MLLLHSSPVPLSILPRLLSSPVGSRTFNYATATLSSGKVNSSGMRSKLHPVPTPAHPRRAAPRAQRIREFADDEPHPCFIAGDAPPSLSSAAIRSFDHDQEHLHVGDTVDPQPFGGQNNQTWSNVRSIDNPISGPQIPETGDIYGQPPSYTACVHDQGNRGLDQTAGFVDGGRPPSYTALVHGQGNSINQFQDGTVKRGSGPAAEFGNGDEAPSVGAVRRPAFSLPSGCGDHNGDGPPPSLNDVAKRVTSQTSESSTTSQIFDPGMSLTGRNFKKFYQEAYYKDEDEK